MHLRRVSVGTSNLVLVVDGDSSERLKAAQLVNSFGYAVDTAKDGVDALTKLAAAPVSAIVTELSLPRMDGFQFLRTLLDRRLRIPTVVLTGLPEIHHGFAAIHELHAFWYLRKPAQRTELEPVLEHALRAVAPADPEDHASAQGSELQALGELTGSSRPMQRVYRLIRRVAPTRTTVLITGASGTGKERVARTIHSLSERKHSAFVPINCAALPEDLIESELFGHEAGAFTGAASRHEGCFEQADGGTLFLDEIGEMPLTMQARLLRVLEECKIRRLGGDSEIPVDVRVLAATNRGIDEMLDQNKLREDLYYRLKVFHLHLAPLRERQNDIPLLAGKMISELNNCHGCEVAGIDPRALAKLVEYPWPGNVRELRNVLECAVIVAKSGEILVRHLPQALFPDAPGHRGEPPSIDGLGPGRVPDGNIRRAAQLLGVSADEVYSFLKSPASLHA